MPEDAPKGKAKFITKKVGPFPVWAWALAGVAFVGLVWYLRKSQGGDTNVSVADSDYGQEPIAPAPPDFGGGNGGGGGGGIGIPLPEPIYPPEPVIPPDWPYQPISPVEPIYETPTQPVMTQPEPTPEPEAPKETPKPTPTKQTSFTWSGKTFRKGDLAAFRKLLKSLPKSSMYSGPNGYAVWAKNHPKVVADFGWPKK